MCIRDRYDDEDTVTQSAKWAFIEVLNLSTKLYRDIWNLKGCKKKLCQFRSYLRDKILTYCIDCHWFCSELSITFWQEIYTDNFQWLSRESSIYLLLKVFHKKWYSYWKHHHVEKSRFRLIRSLHLKRSNIAAGMSSMCSPVSSANWSVYVRVVLPTHPDLLPCLIPE